MAANLVMHDLSDPVPSTPHSISTLYFQYATPSYYLGMGLGMRLDLSINLATLKFYVPLIQWWPRLYSELDLCQSQGAPETSICLAHCSWHGNWMRLRSQTDVTLVPSCCSLPQSSSGVGQVSAAMLKRWGERVHLSTLWHWWFGW